MSDGENVEKVPQKEPTQKELSLSILNALNQLNGNVVAMSTQLQKGYDATVRALDANLKPLADIAVKGQEQLKQAEAAQKQGTVIDHMQQATQGKDGVYRPQGQNGAADPAVMLEIMKLAMQPDPSNSMFAMLGQRMFVESAMSQMYTMRAALKKLQINNMLSEQEYNDFVGAQTAMYQPLIGQAANIGKPNNGKPASEGTK